MTTIDIERLSTLLDHGADAEAAGHTARAAAQEAEQALRIHIGASGNADQTAMLQARVARRRAEQAVASARANSWLRYCDCLKALARKSGVSL